MNDLSKADRRAAREIIEKGLQQEFTSGLNQFLAILTNWKENKTDNRETYHTLYQSVRDYDKHITRRYDNMKGSAYLFIIAGQLVDEAISTDDINTLSDDSKQVVLRIVDFANR